MIYVLNRRSISDLTLELDTSVLIDRTTEWGNPYRLDDHTRQDSVTKYVDYAEQKFSREKLRALDGKALVCHCAPKLCHGNALQLLVAQAKGRNRLWVLVSGEAPRGQTSFEDHVKRSYRKAIEKRLADLPPNAAVIHGGARGVDTYAHQAAHQLGLDTVRWPADWEGYGPSAGPKRNQLMLDLGSPDIVLCFHRNIRSSRGTADMLTRAQRAQLAWELHPIRTMTRHGRTWEGPITGSGSP